MGVNELPNVGRIQGVTLQGGPEPQNYQIQLQYTDAGDVWHQVEMPFLDAMYLLNLLKAAALEVGFSVPDDPRGS